jgi:hypothetical protein
VNVQPDPTHTLWHGRRPPYVWSRPRAQSSTCRHRAMRGASTVSVSEPPDDTPYGLKGGATASDEPALLLCLGAGARLWVVRSSLCWSRSSTAAGNRCLCQRDLRPSASAALERCTGFCGLQIESRRKRSAATADAERAERTHEMARSQSGDRRWTTCHPPVGVGWRVRRR